MAKLIPRNTNEQNQYQNQNGLEWSRDEQNRLASELESARDRAGLRTEIGVFQVERGDTLSVIVKGLKGNFSNSSSVEYRSTQIIDNWNHVKNKKWSSPKVGPKNLNKTNGQLPQVAEINNIWPGQYVWIENGNIIVSDSLPAAPVAPITSPPVISETEVDPDPVVVEPEEEPVVATAETNVSLNINFDAADTSSLMRGNFETSGLTDGQTVDTFNLYEQETNTHLTELAESNKLQIEALEDYDKKNGTTLAADFAALFKKLFSRADSAKEIDNFVDGLSANASAGVEAAIRAEVKSFMDSQESVEQLSVFQNWLLLEGVSPEKSNKDMELLTSFMVMAAGKGEKITDLAQVFDTTKFNDAKVRGILAGEPVPKVNQFLKTKNRLANSYAALKSHDATLAAPMEAEDSFVNLQQNMDSRKLAMARLALEQAGGEIVGRRTEQQQQALSVSKDLYVDLLYPFVDRFADNPEVKDDLIAVDERLRKQFNRGDMARALREMGENDSEDNIDALINLNIEQHARAEKVMILLTSGLLSDDSDFLTDTQQQAVKQYVEMMGQGSGSWWKDAWNRSADTTHWDIAGQATIWGVTIGASLIGQVWVGAAIRGGMLALVGNAGATALGNTAITYGSMGLGLHLGHSVGMGAVTGASHGSAWEGINKTWENFSDGGTAASNFLTAGVGHKIMMAPGLKGQLGWAGGGTLGETTVKTGMDPVNGLFLADPETRRAYQRELAFSGAMNLMFMPKIPKTGRPIKEKYKTRIETSTNFSPLNLTKNRTTTLPEKIPDVGRPIEVNGVTVGFVKPDAPGSTTFELYKADGVTKVRTRETTFDGMKIKLDQASPTSPYQITRETDFMDHSKTLRKSASSKWITHQPNVPYKHKALDGDSHIFEEGTTDLFKYSRTGDTTTVVDSAGVSHALKAGDSATIKVKGQNVKIEFTAADEIIFTRASGSFSMPKIGVPQAIKNRLTRSTVNEDLSLPTANLNRQFSELGKNPALFKNLPNGTPVTFTNKGLNELTVTKNGANLEVEVDGIKHVLNAANPTASIGRAHLKRPLIISWDGTQAQITRRLRPQLKQSNTTPLNPRDLSTFPTGTTWQVSELIRGRLFTGNNVPVGQIFKWTNPKGKMKAQFEKQPTGELVVQAGGKSHTLPAGGGRVEIKHSHPSLTKTIFEWDGTNVTTMQRGSLHRPKKAAAAPTSKTFARVEDHAGLLKIIHNLTSSSQHKTLRLQRRHNGRPQDLDGTSIVAKGFRQKFVDVGGSKLSKPGDTATVNGASGINYTVELVAPPRKRNGYRAKIKITVTKPAPTP